MYRHVEVFGLELVRHFAELLQGVLALGLLEAESLGGLGHLLGHALGAAPVALGDLGQRRHEAEGVVTIVAPVAEQHVLLRVPTPAIVTDVLGQLERRVFRHYFGFVSPLMYTRRVIFGLTAAVKLRIGLF